MFCSRYFAARYFAPRYFPEHGQSILTATLVDTAWYSGALVVGLFYQSSLTNSALYTAALVED